MLQRTFPKTGWKVSIIGFGAWGIGGQWGAVEKQAALDALHAGLDAGMNFIDTADAYGDPPGVSERFVAEAVKGKREKVYIATKVGHFGRPYGHPLSYDHWLHVDLCCDASLGRLRTDYIDLYQCHIANCEDPSVYLEAFDRLIQAGKVRAFGISSNSLKVIEAFNQHDKCAAVQLDYSYVHRAAEREALPYCQRHDIATVVRGPLRMGIATGKFTKDTQFTDEVRQSWNTGEKREHFLRELAVVDKVKAALSTDDSLAQHALRFVISHPAVTVAIPGAKDVAQARANAAAGEAVLSDAQLQAIKDATASHTEGMLFSAHERAAASNTCRR